ncbi:MAG: AAA family ATPase [Anaerolineae bacterium]|nr:AAA family ATPase [Anaerolineae bacterium]
MSLAKLEPTGSSPVPARKRYAWETEETLVERRRKRLRYRIQRLISSMWLWALLLALVVWALLDANMMTAVVNFFPFFLQFVFMAALIIGQFALMFWFLGRTRMYTIWPGAEGVSFADYRGQPELLEQAKQVVKLLRGVRVFEEAGGEPLNGLLLEGPPGTGKTWLAQAISTEANVPFFFVDASSMNSMFFGIAPLKVSNLYRRARKAAKEYGASVIFIDEIDAIGARPGVAAGSDHFMESPDTLPMMFGGMGGGNMGLLSTLLIEMSGFSLEHGWVARKKTWFYKTFLRRNPPKPQKRVLTIGATNRIQTLDPALLRPGRFDKKIRIDAPDLEGRRDIIEYYLSKMAHDESVDPVILASETPFYTPADLKYLLNEALRYALFDGRTYLTMRDIRMAQPEHEMGLRTPIKNLSNEDKRRLAAHEGGHAMAIRLFRPNYRISRVTIIRQGGAHGHVMSYPASEEYFTLDTYENLMNRLRVSIGGKAGEMEFCGEGAQTLGVGIGFGDASDFGQIRAVLYEMANAGMFGPLGANMGQDIESLNPTADMREAMDETFREVLDEVRMAFRLHRDMGEALIALLMQKNELLADEVEAFFDQYGYYTPKVNLNPEREEDVVVVTKEDQKALEGGD